MLSQKAMWARRKARRVHRILEVVACIGVFGCVLLVALALLFPSASSPVTHPGAQPTRIPGVPGAIPADGFTVVGDPTISAQQINAILAYYHSPAAGKGQVIYDLGVRYHIDPVVALAFFHHESSFGRAGEASHTHSPGNLRCIPDHPCVDKQRGGYAQFASWEDGFDAWYKLIHDLYVGQWKLTTVNQIISRYAPVKNPRDAAHRNYVTFINRDIALWRSGKIAL
ncbi:glucosaminidase domain-containing protein [Dictyobacter aurantiacus]|uniref:glucosaminidase domain-containing protein n=1 Tax=Dictyobacter aurantiacus TaxID=1936993 RepID=UPI001358B235|nr:glucosaminidase domain-containing protein [Dictyobacter aurantiacus]